MVADVGVGVRKETLLAKSRTRWRWEGNRGKFLLSLPG